MTRSVFLLLCAVPAFGQLPEHSKVLDAEFANLFSGSDSVPGVLLRPETKGTAIRGIVRTSNGAIAKNADVWAYGIRGNRIPCRERTSTDAQGRFTLHIPTDARLGNVKWGINIFHDGESVSANELGPGKKSGGVVRLEPQRALQLSVRDSDGKPVPAFRVYLQDGRVLDHTGDEPFRIDGLESGVQCMCILANGFAREVLYVDTTAFNPTLLEIQLEPGRTIRGTIRDTDGNTLPNCGVMRFVGYVTVQAGRTALADENGKYRYAGAPKRSQRLMAFACVAKTDREYVNVPFGLTDDTVDGVIPKPVAPVAPAGIAMLAGGGGAESDTGSVSGRVVDPSGNVVRNFIVRLDVPRKRPEGIKWGGFSASYSSIGLRVTDAEGRFRVTGVDRNRAIRLTACVPGFRDAFQDVVITVDASGKPDFNKLTLKLQKTITTTLDVENDAGDIRWYLVAARPEREAYAIGYYIQAGARQFRGSRNELGEIVFNGVELNDGVLAAVRGEQIAVMPWLGEEQVTVDIRDLSWSTIEQ